MSGRRGGRAAGAGRRSHRARSIGGIDPLGALALFVFGLLVAVTIPLLGLLLMALGAGLWAWSVFRFLFPPKRDDW